MTVTVKDCHDHKSVNARLSKVCILFSRGGASWEGHLLYCIQDAPFRYFHSVSMVYSSVFCHCLVAVLLYYISLRLLLFLLDPLLLLLQLWPKPKNAQRKLIGIILVRLFSSLIHLWVLCFA